MVVDRPHSMPKDQMFTMASNRPRHPQNSGPNGISPPIAALKSSSTLNRMSKLEQLAKLPQAAG